LKKKVMTALSELKGYEDEDGPDEDEEDKEAIYAENKVGQERLNWIWLFECGQSVKCWADWL
jgi:hypothetical protein